MFIGVRPIRALNQFGAFFEIRCNSEDRLECFRAIENIADAVGHKLNLFACIYAGCLSLGGARIGSKYQLTQKFRDIQNKYFAPPQKEIEWKLLAKEAESLDDFMAYVVLTDALKNMTIPPLGQIEYKKVFIYRGKYSGLGVSNTHQVILLGTRGYGFLSCYGINKKPYEFFTDPFDKYEWISIFLTILSLTLISYSLDLKSCDSVDVGIAGFSVLLEISVPLATKRCVPGKVKCLFWLWVYAV